MKYTINKAKAANACRTDKGGATAKVIVLRLSDNSATKYETAADIAEMFAHDPDSLRVDAAIIEAVKAYAKVYTARNYGMLKRDLAHMRLLINPESAEAKAEYDTAKADWDLELALRRADAERKLRDTVINGREAYVTAAKDKADKAFTRKEEKVAKLNNRAETAKRAANEPNAEQKAAA